MINLNLYSIIDINRRYFMVIIILDEMKKNNDLNKYLPSFIEFHSWLVEKESYVEVPLEAAAEVLQFLKLGTKARAKKAVKTYFEQYDVNVVKSFIPHLSNLTNTQVHDDLSFIDSNKKALITSGMVEFVTSYIQTFSEHVNEEHEHIAEVILDEETKYERWLRGSIAPLLQQLKEQYNAKNLSQESIDTFVVQFRKFVGKKIFIRITEINERSIVGVPVELTLNGYEQMRHPFLAISWEVSAPLTKPVSYGVDDIIETSFSNSRNENFRHLLLFVDFNRATVITQSLTDMLKMNLKPTTLQEAFSALNIVDERAEQLEAYVAQTLVSKSEVVQAALSEQLKAIEQQFEHVQAETEKLQNEQHQLDEKKREWQNILARIDYYQQLEAGNIYDDSDEKESITFNKDTFLDTMQSLFYYNDDAQLIYTKDTIRSFVYALQANVLTVLAGPSGTGKSSIVHAFANAVQNVEVRMVPVQSSWTDTQDLLGYFHPTDKAFVPTPFMEALAEASKNENKLFLICLDEMNLAHVEYYFSEILSAREEKKQEIRLYSKRHWQTAKLIMQDDKSDMERLQNATDLIETYPPIFSIPKNVRFIGTLNMDHTVKPLSPKVIDRSFIIEINHLKANTKKEIVSSLKQIEGKIAMDYRLFEEAYMNSSKLESYISEIQAISNIFEDFPNASLNSRGMKHIQMMLSYCKNEEEAKTFIDAIIYGKILPRLEIKKSEFESIEANVKNALQKYENAYRKLEKMIVAKHTVNFW